MPDVNTIIQLVQNVGIVAVVLFCSMWFIKYMYDKNREDLSDQRNRYNAMLEDERTRHTEEMEKITEALNNNTVALTKLTSMLDTNESDV